MFYLQPIYAETIQLALSKLDLSVNNAKNCYQFFILLKEKTDICIGFEEYHLNEYDLFFLMPTEHIAKIGNQNVLALVLRIDGDYLLNVIPDLERIIHHLRQQDTLALEPLRAIFASLSKHYFNQNPKNSFEFVSSFYKFLHILSNMVPTPDLYVQKGTSQLDLKNDRIQKIKSYIESNFNKQLTMNELADTLYLTPQYLSKFIKEQLGVTFIHYLNDLRLKHAVKELLSTDHGITQISFNNGFPNLTAFNKVFRDTYQDTPLKYRQLMQKSEQLEEKEPQPEAANLSAETQQFAKFQLEKLLKKQDAFTKALDSEKINIQADSEAEISFNHSGLEMINLGFAVNMLSHAFQQQLTALQNDLHFKYARFQGIIEPEIIDKIPNTDQYNFSNANRILDYLYSIQLLPFIEIGRKPRKFNANRENYIYLSNLTPVFTTIEEQNHFISCFLHHCINRYGLSEVEKWRFENWLPHGMHLEYTGEAIRDFILNYKNIYDTIKSILPSACIGGLGYNLAVDLEVLSDIFIQFKKANVQLDFLSLTTFHIEIPHQEQRNPYITQDPEYLSRKVTELRGVLPISDLPLFIAEWNFDYTSRNFLNDSIFKALFVTKNILEMSAPLQALGYWLFSDVTSEYKDTTKMLFGGHGLVTIDGIKKPAYHAYKMISMLGPQVIKKGDGFIITSKGRDSYTLLLYHYVHPSDFYCLRYDTEIFHDNINDIFGPKLPRDYSIELMDVIPGNYRIKTYSLNKNHGSILDEWNKMSAIQNVSANEIAYFSNITVPSQSIYYVNAKESLMISDHLEMNEIHLLSIKLEI